MAFGSIYSQQFSICPEMNVGAGQVGQDFSQTGAFRSHLSRPALDETEGVKGVRQAGQVGQDFSQTRAFSSHLSRPALAETEGAKGVRQVGMRLNRLT